MIFITVTCLFRAIVIQRLFGGACQRRRSQAHPRLLPEGYRATSPRALAGGHRPKRSVASIAHFAQWVDTRGCLSKFDRRECAESPPHPDRKSDPTSPRKRGEVIRTSTLKSSFRPAGDCRGRRSALAAG